jgi:hypothetical protein
MNNCLQDLLSGISERFFNGKPIKDHPENGRGDFAPASVFSHHDS